MQNRPVGPFRLIRWACGARHLRPYLAQLVNLKQETLDQNLLVPKKKLDQNLLLLPCYPAARRLAGGSTSGGRNWFEYGISRQVLAQLRI